MSSPDTGATETPPAPKQPMRPQQRRRLYTRLSAVIFILVPTLLSGLYYSLIASDQYAVEVRFAVRGINNQGGGELLGLMAGLSTGGSTTGDSHILMDYIHSREIIERLRENIDLTSLYSSEKADLLSAFNPAEPIEEFVEYWQDMTTLSYDTGSQIIVLEVRAFTPEDAKLIAENVLKLSEKLVNDLTIKARRDAVGQAEQEVARMEKRLKASRLAVRSFRETKQVIDPSKTAESQLGLLAQLEVQLATEKAQLSSLVQFMDKNSPRIIVLTGKIRALEEQVEAERARLGANKGDVSGALAGLLGDYRNLLMDQEFAEKGYISALSSVETARLEASRQQRYLATFIRPSLPEDALYPKRWLNILLTAILTSIAWAIGLLVTYSIRDHAT